MKADYTDQPLRVLSLGCGIQSSAVFLMSLRGMLPRLDAAIFADTGWETQGVYDTFEWLLDQGEAAGVPVYRVMKSNLRDDIVANPLAWNRIPLYTLNPDGTRGQIQRQCTLKNKIDPINKFLRIHLLGLKRNRRAATGVIEQWFGISVDEQRRVRMSKAHWITNRYPLIFDLPKPFTRWDCERWLSENYPGVPFVRSACIGCPYRAPHEWRAIKADPVMWADVCAVDRAVRKPDDKPGEFFLHPSRVPLEDADLSEECEGQTLIPGCEYGMCGL